MDDSQTLTDIISACKKGDHQAYSQLVSLYSSRCFGYFYRLTGNKEDSNDLLSELFLKLVTKIGYYDSGSFDLWIFKIASNIFYDHLRAKQRDKKAIETRKQQMLENPAGYTENADLPGADVVGMHLERLDTATREIILLRYYSELSFKEIAKMRKEPIGTVLSKVHRGLARLRQLMEQQNEPKT